MSALHGQAGSCWIASASTPNYPSLEESLHAETVVVGAGIVGLTTALRVAEAGRSVIVIEALKVGEQVTGRSTAKITTQHGLIYRHLIEARGREAAQAYADANRAGVSRILDWIGIYGIDCDLERRSAYAYTQDHSNRKEIEREADAARQLGLEAETVDRAPLPFDTGAALVFPDQAQFNPAKYLVGLSRAVTQRVGRIFENSRARLIGEASRWRVVTNGGTVHAEHVVVTTNMTVKSPVGMANRTQPRSHTVWRVTAADGSVTPEPIGTDRLSVAFAGDDAAPPNGQRGEAAAGVDQGANAPGAAPIQSTDGTPTGQGSTASSSGSATPSNPPQTKIAPAVLPEGPVQGQ